MAVSDNPTSGPLRRLPVITAPGGVANRIYFHGKDNRGRRPNQTNDAVYETMSVNSVFVSL